MNVIEGVDATYSCKTLGHFIDVDHGVQLLKLHGEIPNGTLGKMWKWKGIIVCLGNLKYVGTWNETMHLLNACIRFREMWGTLCEILLVSMEYMCG